MCQACKNYLEEARKQGAEEEASGIIEELKKLRAYNHTTEFRDQVKGLDRAISFIEYRNRPRKARGAKSIRERIDENVRDEIAKARGAGWHRELIDGGGLQEVLEKYGTHLWSCPTLSNNKATCMCGLSDALAREDPPEPAPLEKLPDMTQWGDGPRQTADAVNALIEHVNRIEARGRP